MLCYVDFGFVVGLGFTCLAEFLLFCHAVFGFVDGLGGCFLTEGFDVAALVLDVGGVDVDELQSDFLELDFDVGCDGFEEFVAVGVEFLD